MSERMTAIRLPNTFGLADYGDIPSDKMIALYREYGARLRAQAEAIETAANHEFQIESYTGRRGKAYVETNATIDRLVQALASYRPDGVGGEDELVTLISEELVRLGIRPRAKVQTYREDGADIARAILARLPALPVEGGEDLGSLHSRSAPFRPDNEPEPDCNVPGSRAWWLVRYVAGQDPADEAGRRGQQAFSGGGEGTEGPEVRNEPKPTQVTEDDLATIIFDNLKWMDALGQRCIDGDSIKVAARKCLSALTTKGTGHV